MTDIKLISLAVLAPLVVISMPLAGRADEEVIERRTIIQSSGHAKPGPGTGENSVSAITTKSYTLKFRERLKDLDKQSETAKSKEWINADEFTKFKAELDRLNALEAKIEGAGFPKADVDDLEKQITKFNAELSTASSKPKGTTSSAAAAGKAPAKAAAPATTKKTTTAAGDTKSKTAQKKTVASPAKK